MFVSGSAKLGQHRLQERIGQQMDVLPIFMSKFATSVRYLLVLLIHIMVEALGLNYSRFNANFWFKGKGKPIIFFIWIINMRATASFVKISFTD